MSGGRLAPRASFRTGPACEKQRRREACKISTPNLHPRRLRPRQGQEGEKGEKGKGKPSKSRQERNRAWWGRTSKGGTGKGGEKGDEKGGT